MHWNHSYKQNMNEVSDINRTTSPLGARAIYVTKHF